MMDNGVCTTENAEKCFALDVSAVLQQFYRSGTDCDVHVKCGEESFPAHSFWLRKAIPYFATADGALTNRGDAVEVGRAADPFDLRGSPLSEDALKLVLDIAYGLLTEITPENCMEVHRAADYLGMDGLAGFCVGKLMWSKRKKTVLKLMGYAYGEFVGSKELRKHFLEDFFLNDFHEVARLTGYESLPLACVQDVLRMKMAQACPETKACFEFALCWVLADISQRVGSLKGLLSFIRIEEVDFPRVICSQTYQTFMAKGCVDAECKGMLSNLVHANSAELDSVLGSDRCKAPPDNGWVYLFADRCAEGGVVRFLKLSGGDFPTFQWHSFSPGNSLHAGDVVLAARSFVGTNKLFLWCKESRPQGLNHRLFGYDTEADVQLRGEFWFPDVFRFPDIFQHSLRAFDSRPEHAFSACLDVVYGRLHAWFLDLDGLCFFLLVHSGDFDPFRYAQDPLERCNTEWTAAGVKFHSPEFLRKSRFFIYGDAIFHNLGNSPEVVLSRGMFDPSPVISNPLFEHRLPGVTTYKGKLYLAGGVGETQRGAEFYDPERDAWEALPSLPDSCHKDIHLVAAADTLYVIDREGAPKRVFLLSLRHPQRGWQRGPNVPVSAELPADTNFIVTNN